MPTITGPILDSAGRPANGLLRVRASRPFDIGAGHVTQAVGSAVVRDGVPFTSNGSAWSLPPTPDGAHLTIEQELDGDASTRTKVTVPDLAQITYAELLFNRGDGESGANPYWWDLTGGQSFPPEAVDGDIGYDRTTGDVYRYDA